LVVLSSLGHSVGWYKARYHFTYLSLKLIRHQSSRSLLVHWGGSMDAVYLIPENVNSRYEAAKKQTTDIYGSHIPHS